MRILSHAEDAECAEARIVSLACGLRGACFSPTDDTDVHESLLSTDDTDDTVFVTVLSQVQRATICSSVQFPYYPLTKRNRVIRGRYISFVFRKLSSLLGSNQRDNGE